MPLFSIITVTKNNDASLQKTAASITAQSCTDYEWIIVNGGAALPKYYPALLIEEPDNGLYEAMNKGLRQARGVYLLFLNAGDCLSDPDILRTLSIIAMMEEPDILYGDALETGMHYKKARSHQTIDCGMITHHQAIYYKREIVVDLTYDTQYRIAGDYDFTRRALKKAKTIHYCPAALCLFEIGGLSQKHASLGRKEEYTIRRRSGVSLYKNILITGRQFIAAIVKSVLPPLYRYLRAV